jgi:hypothetical protein
MSAAAADANTTQTKKNGMTGTLFDSFMEKVEYVTFELTTTNGNDPCTCIVTQIGASASLKSNKHNFQMRVETGCFSIAFASFLDWITKIYRQQMLDTILVIAHNAQAFHIPLMRRLLVSAEALSIPCWLRWGDSLQGLRGVSYECLVADTAMTLKELYESMQGRPAGKLEDTALEHANALHWMMKYLHLLSILPKQMLKTTPNCKWPARAVHSLISTESVTLWPDKCSSST